MPANDPIPWITGISIFIILPMILLTIALTVFWIVELIDVVRREFPDPNTKILWILVILFTHPIGTIIYYFAGKPQGALPGETRRSPGASN